MSWRLRAAILTAVVAAPGAGGAELAADHGPATLPATAMAAAAGTAAIVMPAATLPAATPPAAVPAAATPAAPTVWRLPGTLESMRIEGEDGRMRWPVFVPANAARTIARFQLGYTAAISVMPEASWLAVSINGQSVGRVPVSAPAATKILSFDVPPGLVVPGWNAVEITVSERHRVDCSQAATYELWTQIDNTRTGFVGDLPKVATLDDLPALPVDSTGATPLHLALPPDPSPEDLARAVQVVERVALRGHYLHPVVDTRADPTGLQVAVAPFAALDASIRGAAAGLQGGVRFGTTSSGSPLLVVSGASEAELDRAIEELDPVGPEPKGTPDGLQALSGLRGTRLEPGQSLSFTDLGLKSRAFTGRLYRVSFDVTLPPDAYLADYGEARLSLDGGYAAGLTHDARFLVRVNGIIDGNLDLDRPGGAVLQGQTIHMPLDAFRPGRNHIEIEAQLPAKADETCDTLTSINAKERFLLLGTSTLSIPTLARVAQFPSLSAAFVGNFRVTPAAAPRLVLPRAAAGPISAAATLLTNAALSTGVPSETSILRSLPQGDTRPALVVGTSADMTAPLLTSTGIDAGALSAAWPAGAHPRGGGAPAPSDGARSLADESDSSRLDAWGQHVGQQEGWLGSAGRGLGWLRGMAAGSLRSAGLIEYPDGVLTVNGETTFVLAQGLLDDMPLTLVAAPDDAALAAGAGALTDPSRIGRLQGRAASLDDGDAGTTLMPSHDQAFFRTQSFSIGNDRLIAAGWLSSHAGWYIGAALLFVIALGSTTWAALTFARRES